MKREEEIANASTVYSEYEYNQIDFENGFFTGAKWADENPKSPWISVEDDLPCNHEELIDKEYSNQITKVIIVRYRDESVAFARMIKHEGQWKFSNKVTHWMPIPELPKE